MLEPRSRADSATVRELREAAEVAGRYPFDPLLVCLYDQLLGRVALSQRGAPPHPLRICCAGGDATLHKLLQAYVVLRCTYDHLCAEALLRFYVVPVGRSNRLAAFIAHYDGWYRRHVLTMHSGGQPTVPHVLVPQITGGGMSTRRSEESESSAPVDQHSAAPLQQSLAHYFTGAHSVLQLQLWNIRCWLSLPGDGSSPSDAPFVSFAFCQSVEVQLASAGDAGRDLTVTYTVADPWGVSYNSSAGISGRFSALSFASWSSDPLHLPSSGRLQACPPQIPQHTGWRRCLPTPLPSQDPG